MYGSSIYAASFPLNLAQACLEVCYVILSLFPMVPRCIRIKSNLFPTALQKTLNILTPVTLLSTSSTTPS